MSLQAAVRDRTLVFKARRCIPFRCKGERILLPHNLSFRDVLARDKALALFPAEMPHLHLCRPLADLEAFNQLRSRVDLIFAAQRRRRRALVLRRDGREDETLLLQNLAGALLADGPLWVLGEELCVEFGGAEAGEGLAKGMEGGLEIVLGGRGRHANLRLFWRRDAIV